MNFKMKDPKAGDMIRVGIGSLYHYGIYVSDGEVIEFGPAPHRQSALSAENIRVAPTDIDAFLDGGFLEVAELSREERKKARRASAVVEEARRRIGEGGYNILYNNCEHFAYECLMGEHYSSQTDRVREYFRSVPVVDVYLAVIPEGGELKPLSHPERQREIDGVSNEGVKRDKYYSWRLLEYGLFRSFGLKINEAELKRNGNGCWQSPRCYISITHSEGLAAVAVSRSAVGIDAEPIGRSFREGFAARMLTERELKLYEETAPEERDGFLLDAWCRKEAIFKSLDRDSFSPRTLDSEERTVVLRDVELDGRAYRLAVSTDTPERIRIFDRVALRD